MSKTIDSIQSPSPVPTAASYFDMPLTEIISQRSPTVPRPASLAFSDLTISDSGSATRDSHERGDRHGSEAAVYLAQFHSTGLASGSISTQRPRTKRTFTGPESGLPSLSNTPSSSMGTVASTASYRPFPPRRKPLSEDFQPRSPDRVRPPHSTTAPSSPTQLMKPASSKSSASTSASLHVAEAEDVSYDRRKPTWRHSDQSGSSLKQLLANGVLRASSEYARMCDFAKV